MKNLTAFCLAALVSTFCFGEKYYCEYSYYGFWVDVDSDRMEMMDVQEHRNAITLFRSEKEEGCCFKRSSGSSKKLFFSGRAGGDGIGLFKFTFDTETKKGFFELNNEGKSEAKCKLN